MQDLKRKMGADKGLIALSWNWESTGSKCAKIRAVVSSGQEAGLENI